MSSATGYSAPDVYLATLQAVRAPGRVEEPLEFTNPIMAFEDIGQEMGKNGVYYAWSTFDKANKLKHMDSLAKPNTPENPSEIERAVAWQRWHRNLVFIIYEETRARREGWEEVAARAARLLIPLPKMAR
jgi:hypothetical protein